MRLDLSAERPDNSGYYYAEILLPAEEYEIRDAMQKLRAVGREDGVWISVLECENLPELENVRLDSPTLDELNFFTKRLASMTDEEETVFYAVIGEVIPENPEGRIVSMKDLINCAYGLEGVMFAPNISDDEQLGQFVIEGDLDDEVNALPDAAIPLLDRKKIGERFRTTYGCEYINGTAVFVGDYERPEIYDGRSLPESEETESFVFRLRVGEYPTGGTAETEDDAEWLSLPTNIGIARDMAVKHHEPSIESCVCYDLESTIPQIDSEVFRDMLDFDKLNKLAWKFDLLSPADQIKFKATLCAKQPNSIRDALDIAENLDQYEFYSLPDTSDQFFKVYLNHHMDARFDGAWLDTLLTRNEGDKLLERLGASVTDYGVISARGRSLYELVPYDEPKVKELTAQTMTDEKLDVIELLDRKALFLNGRLTPEEIPEGLYAYDLRFSDEQDRFVSIEPKVRANHGGTVLMKELLDFGESGAISFTEDSSPNFLSEEMTVKEFAKTDMNENETQQMGGMQL